MVVYESAAKYLESCATLQQKIAAVDAVILALYTALANSATTANLQEYSLNDGQVIIKSILSNPKQIESIIYAMERMRIMYSNRLTGRVTRLVDTKNFMGRSW